jgi:hypothetical protein
MAADVIGRLSQRFQGVSRLRASATHLTLSASIGLVAVAIMLLGWYPDEYFRISGGSMLVMIMVSVDVGLGPLITLAVFDPAKGRRLVYDLMFIATVQLAALVYGGYIMFEARPAYAVFVTDRFDVINVIDLPAEKRAAALDPRFRDLPWLGPRLAVSRLPSDPAARREVMMAAAQGVDLMLEPKLWVPYADGRDVVLARAKPLDAFRGVAPGNAAAIDAALAELGRTADTVRAVGVNAPHGMALMLLDARTAEPLEMIDAAW